MTIAPPEKQHTAPVEIRNMVKDGEVDAIITSRIASSNTRWLTKLGVPYATLMIKEPPRDIEIDVDQFAFLGIEEAIRSGRKAIGPLVQLPVPIKRKSKMGDALLAAFEKVAARKGVTLVLPKRVYFTPDQTWEEKGSILCEKVLRSKVPVDLIIVYP